MNLPPPAPRDPWPSHRKGSLEQWDDLLSQVALAKLLAINQASVSRAERRSDYLVGTLRAIIEALGGRLHLVAEFPDRTVELQLPDAEDGAPARSKAGAQEC